jgi:tetratricopeptide (TPR) repeat protein
MSHKKSSLQSILLGAALALSGFCILAVMLYQLPQVHDKLDWRIEYASINIKSWFNPVKPLPTALPTSSSTRTAAPLAHVSTPTPSETPTLTATATPTPEISPTPTLTPTPIPGKVVLPAPKYEKEDLNDCGPATLAMYLHFYGWSGDQKTISDIIKPIRADRNVNVEELMYYINNKTTGLRGEYRVGGNTDTLKKIIASGIPIIVESGMLVDKNFWANDDRWVGHYLLLTGYDDATKTFIVQDSEKGANTRQTYDQLDKDWQAFNRVYIMVYPTDQEQSLKDILGSNWDPDLNRQYALDLARTETEKDPTNGFAWFNEGSNLVYFERYTEAAVAYDTARTHKLPQRMLRYQFGPFIAYFHSGRTDDLLALTDYALERTPNSEEALLWKGWALYRTGKKQEAVDLFQQALKEHPDYGDAQYALTYVVNN